MGTVLQDLRYSLRAFRRSPGFTATALAALALGIGANTAIFSVVNAVLLRPLPYPHPERMVQLLGLFRWGVAPYTNVPLFNAYLAQSQVFEDVTAYDWRGGEGLNLTGGDSLEQVRGEHVSFEYFRLFGAPFVAGRGFTAEEDHPGGGRVVILAGGFWQRRFGSDGALVGKSILLGGDPYTVIGIVSPAFAPDPPVDLWLPLQADPNSTDQATFLFAAARLKPGVTLERAKAALQLAAQEFRRKFPDAMGPAASFTAEPLRQYMTGEVQPALLILLVAVACVLCIACANVANLLLARATGRAREIAIRAAIGAARARIVRQLLVESVTLSLAGGAMGLALGYAGVRALLRLNAGGIPRIGPDGAAVTLDARVLVFALLLSVVTGILFGLVPALRASRIDLNTALKDSGSRSGARGHNRMRRLIIVTEIALAFVLLTGAGLLLRSFAALGKVALGFDSHYVLTMESALNGTRFDSTAAIASAVRQCEERIAAIPGVEAVAAAPSVPLESSMGMGFRIADRPLGDRTVHGSGWWRYVTWRYFDVYKIPILRGRGFTVRDDAGAPPVALIDAAMARHYWPDGNPIGQRIRLYNGDPQSAEPYREIVGVVADVQELGLRQAPGAATYVPLPQVTDSVMMHAKGIAGFSWAIRTKVPPFSVLPAIQHEIRSAAGLSVARVRPMDQVVAQATAGDRFNTILLGIFACMAILLASIGLYGLMAYTMEQRTREFGIRLALGAGASRLRNRIVLEAIALAVTGTLIGLGAALAVTRLMIRLLYGVQATDPLILASVALLLLTVALLASLLPSRRAARIDPIVALRHE
jgi:predicted permease